MLFENYNKNFNKDLLIIKNDILSYYIENLGYIDIPLNLISLIEDKSEYDTYSHGHGGWYHKIILYFNHFDTYYKSLDDKFKLYFKFNNKSYLQIIFCLVLSQ